MCYYRPDLYAASRGRVQQVSEEMAEKLFGKERIVIRLIVFSIICGLLLGGGWVAIGAETERLVQAFWIALATGTLLFLGTIVGPLVKKRMG